MKLKKFDVVKIIEDLPQLTEKEIYKGYSGVVVETKGDLITVWVLNPYNKGETAFVDIAEKSLVYLYEWDKDSSRLEMEEFFNPLNREKYQKLSKIDVKEYDVVELINEKPQYLVEGVHKGDRGCVISEYAIKGKWNIIFSERGTGKDIAEISVDRNDFIVIDKF